MKSGKSYERTVEAPLGNPSNPMDMSRCKEKFEKCVATSGVSLGPEKVNDLLSVIENLEAVEDVSLITSLMTG